MKVTPKRLMFFLNIYGPLVGAGIRIDDIRDDWRECRTSMKLRWYNRNIVGTHFGGSLYAMVDPQYMLMLMNILGPDYHVWDKRADIDFIRPGKGRVSAHFTISQEVIDEIKEKTANGEKFLPEFKVNVVDDEGKHVAAVNKTLYVRKKPRHR